MLLILRRIGRRCSLHDIRATKEAVDDIAASITFHTPYHTFLTLRPYVVDFVPLAVPSHLNESPHLFCDG